MKTMNTVVLQCEKVTSALKKEFKAKLPKEVTHAVQLEDSVLFCEGGGQPSDMGTINSTPVFYVGRNSNGKVLHFTSSAVEPNSTVTVDVDWNRRFDHMQQHSGQHLISAIAETNFFWETTSWWLGESICNVEFKQMKKEFPVNWENLTALEEQANGIIRENRPVTARVVAEEENSTEDCNEPEDSRKSTERHHGALRVVEIENLDKNPCCGTHISQTSELQVVKIMSFEKARGNFRVFFHVGDRVIKAMHEMYQREVNLRGLLSCGAEEHFEMIKKSQTEYRTLAKAHKNLQSEVAIFLAEKLLSTNEKEPHRVISLHREDADIAFFSSIANSILKESPNSVCLFMSGQGGEGMFLLQTQSDDIVPFGKKVAELLNGRGGGKNNRFQGKVKDLEKFPEAVEYLVSNLPKNS